jgi:hypothetical protein
MRTKNINLFLFFTRLLLVALLSSFSTSLFARGHITFEQLKHLPKTEQIKVIDNIRAVVATIEQRQRFGNKANNYSATESKIIKLWSLIITKAHAETNFQIEGDELCMFAGWPSYTLTVSGRTVCLHPDNIRDNASKKKLALRKSYRDFKAKILQDGQACPKSKGILCNPTLFGKLNYCAPGGSPIEAVNSSISCWKMAKSKETKDDEFIESLIKDNGTLSEDFDSLMKMIYSMCLCNGKFFDKEGKSVRVINKSYSSALAGHRTCAGLLNQAKALTEIAFKENSCTDSSTTENIKETKSILYNINSKLTQYLNEELYKSGGNKLPSDFYEKLLDDSATKYKSHAKERANRVERRDIDIADDQYCSDNLNKNIFEDEDAVIVHPTISHTRVDENNTSILTITTVNGDAIDMNNYTIRIEPETTVTSNRYTYTQIDNEVSVTISLIYKGEAVGNTITTSIPGKDDDAKLPTLTLSSEEEGEDYLKVSFTVEQDDKRLSPQEMKKKNFTVLRTFADDVALEDGLETDKEDGTDTFSYKRKKDTDYTVKFSLMGNTGKLIDQKKITIPKLGSVDDVKLFTIKIVSKKEDEKYSLEAKIIDKDDKVVVLPDGHSVSWYVVKDEPTKGLTYDVDRTDGELVVNATLSKGTEEVDTASTKIEPKKDVSEDLKGSISIVSQELNDDKTYELKAKITINGEVVDAIPKGHKVEWIVSTTESDDADDDKDEPFSGLDSSTASDSTASGVLSLDVAQAELSKVVEVQLIKGDSKVSDTTTLDGSGIDLDDDDEEERVKATNNTPYQVPLAPGFNAPKPKMILRGKDSHQGRWGY